MLDPAVVAIVAAIAAPFLAGGFGVLGIWLGKRGDRTISQETTTANAWLQRLAAVEEKDKARGEEVRQLREELDTVKSTLDQFNERWRVVMSAVSQLFWQIAQQWPDGAPHPILDARLIRVLDAAGVGDLIPAAWRGNAPT